MGVLIRVDVHVDVVDVGDPGGEAPAGGGGDLVAFVNGAIGVDVDGDVGNKAVTEPPNLGVGDGLDAGVWPASWLMRSTMAGSTASISR